MRRKIVASLAEPPATVFPIVADLGTYPEWMGLVRSVEAVANHVWLVTLRAKVGPLARSKRLRMRRTVHESPTHVRFERHEDDGRQHSAWTLDGRVEPEGQGGAEVTVELSYDGGLWSVALEAVLGGQVDDAVVNLARYVAVQAT